jgi:hypothetical protein
MTIPLKDMIAELRRELRHRRTVYPSLVKRGALSEEPIGQSPPACSRNDQNRKPTAPLPAMGTKRQNRIALNLRRPRRCSASAKKAQHGVPVRVDQLAGLDPHRDQQRDTELKRWPVEVAGRI